MKLEEGKYYTDASGNKVGPMARRMSSWDYEYEYKYECESGTYTESGRHCPTADCPFHLVSEYGEPMNFKVGDIVKWGDDVGKVTEVVGDRRCAVVFQKAKTAAPYWFYADGYIAGFGLGPKLQFVRRPKKKVKKTLKVYGMVNDRGIVEYVCAYEPISYRVADVKPVEFTAEVEVEEE